MSNFEDVQLDKCSNLRISFDENSVKSQKRSALSRSLSDLQMQQNSHNKFVINYIQNEQLMFFVIKLECDSETTIQQFKHIVINQINQDEQKIVLDGNPDDYEFYATKKSGLKKTDLPCYDNKNLVNEIKIKTFFLDKSILSSTIYSNDDSDQQISSTQISAIIAQNNYKFSSLEKSQGHNNSTSFTPTCLENKNKNNWLNIFRICKY